MIQFIEVKMAPLAKRAAERLQGCFGFTVITLYERSNHRHLSNIDCLSFVMCLPALLVIGFFSFFFAADVYSTNEANKAGSMRH